ncbi:MAG: DUF2934 domain-containing protein [Gammaproteobacteria bacterium]|nr:DUF2934 domain-containing protein [Gammaproteobacteria bacterium]
MSRDARPCGFVPGCEVNDWLQAEAEIDHVLTRA